MLAVMGAVIVLVGVIGGYLLEHGNLHMLWQPAELVIIGGAAFGAFLIGYPPKLIKAVVEIITRILTNKSTYKKDEYMDVMRLLSDIFSKIRKDGLISIESDVDAPEKSKIFTKYPSFLGRHHAVTFVTDTLRTVMTTTIEPHELEALLETELDAHHDAAMLPSKSVNTVADSLPGLGIVAAVLGVVLTMSKMGEPPEVLGHSIGAALVGTFLGVLLCYGFVGPLSRNMEQVAGADAEYLTVLKVALMAFIRGAPPQISVEFGRRVIPSEVRPTFLEVESALKAKK
ncbi:MAG: flagellar motor stator protein MotA [Nitrospinae bacterium]|nr:flagellar motor stator protein MotA [Nitrospinota bacterium]MBF0634573.1 flagellar motor stator protein MotA [Nitrospinota bacterium]